MMQSKNLDTTDRNILNLLQQDGLMTYKEIAGKAKISMTNAVERIKYLREEGYIKKTVALINTEKVRSLFIAFPHIQLKIQSEETLKDFQEKMAQCPEVMECYHLTGHFDFMIKIALPDMVSYNEFLRNKIGILPYVGNIQSFLVLSASKLETAYQL
ncbi:Lrp/AsnC family transcriptional regulator [Pedobacter agri]|uniref:Lrp/AsnC family transcriptional regulator n=1 Tax=Pedobacter agri TaxID=454586 RepID=UPI00292F988B|nr:Lrp/AsnC family transcriptional regulator [Pedobacter agri]